VSNQKGAPFKGLLLALPKNIRLGWSKWQNEFFYIFGFAQVTNFIQKQVWLKKENLLDYPKPINMVKYNADWEIMITYENLQIVWSQLFTDMLIFVYIWSNLNIFWFIGIRIWLVW
jgi:hypothetical protein